MRVSPNFRTASHAPACGTMNATIIRRWALVRLILGFLQMFGAVFAVAMLVQSGITPLAISAVLVTAVFTGTSQLIFQVWKRGRPTNGRSDGGNLST
jgi:hypothetical protein